MSACCIHRGHMPPDGFNIRRSFADRTIRARRLRLSLLPLTPRFIAHDQVPSASFSVASVIRAKRIRVPFRFEGYGIIVHVSLGRTLVCRKSQLPVTAKSRRGYEKKFIFRFPFLFGVHSALFCNFHLPFLRATRKTKITGAENKC